MKALEVLREEKLHDQMGMKHLTQLFRVLFPNSVESSTSSFHILPNLFVSSVECGESRNRNLSRKEPGVGQVLFGHLRSLANNAHLLG